MALIKCPECGNAVSTAADICPHCGYPIKKQLSLKSQEKVVLNYPKPKNTVWIKKWKSKATAARWIWTLFFLTTLVFLAVSIILLCTDKDGTDSKISWVIMVAVASIVAIIMFALWLSALITIKVRTRQFDGYTVLVYVGFKHCLVIEGDVQDSVLVNRFLYGHLPNNKQVWASISFWDGSIKMGIGKEDN